MRATALTLLLLVCPALARAGSAPSAEAVLAEARAAAGGEAWDRIRTLRSTGTLRTGGLEGSAEALDDLERGRFVDRFTLGPMSGAKGYDGTVIWSQDTARQVREESGGEERLATVNEVYRRRLAYWFPARGKASVELRGARREGGRELQVLTLTPEGGRPFDLWIDAATHLVDRVVEKMALETRTTFFSDYRVVEGVRLPFKSRSTNGEEKYDQVVELTSIAVNVPVADGAFAMPAPPPPDFAFADGRDATTVPFQLVNNHIYVEVKLNGQGPFRLLCDTGGANVVSPTLAARLGLRSEGGLQGRGVGEKSEDFSLTKVETVTLGDVTLRDQLFVVFPLEPLGNVEGIPVHGLVGYEVFKRFAVEVDYEAGRLTLTSPPSFRYAGKGVAVPFRFNGHVPQVDGKIDGIPGKFDIDTGSRASVDLLGPFAEQHGLARRYRAGSPRVTGWGVGGPARGQVVRARRLELGAVVIREPVAMISTQKAGAFVDPYVAGNVGGGVLRRFKVTFDYAGRVMYLEPNAHARERDVFDRGGLWANLGGQGYEVVDVPEGGPAARAGLRAGDRIVGVNGAPASAMPLAEFRALLRSRPGTRVKLTVESGGQRRDVVLVLRELS